MTVLIVFFGVIAALYASVGFGGGSSYSALLVAMSVSAAAIPLISLSCNLIVAAGGVAHRARIRSIPWRQALPLVALSVPAAWLGGRTPIAEEVFLALLGAALVCSGGILLFGKTGAPSLPIVPSGPVLLLTGTGVGYLSGLVGIGGGIFLAPLLHLFRWNTPRRIAATASLFILFNSAAGLIGQIQKTGEIAPAVLREYGPLIVAVLIGGQVGSRLGAALLPEQVLRAMTAILVLAVGLRLLFPVVRRTLGG
ncbi:sulfite exporter TauE/SafE family protein [Parvularcula sp. LCG005]|uniref:sulfite exporter TauE/SafE family protein n=1 Tax=Parvularcula sp. LCG005 TaxID=3078805 RepID=UPI00294280D5|nr:sulfite exporter TauE/SafE family protein [Parvularcula sp. LCG005]WOI52214.1 sulfite exporter TauE/SafE family protein [Parvularcula sp. LCG005]